PRAPGHRHRSGNDDVLSVMTLRARITSDERGAVLTIVAVAMLVLVLAVALVLDVANWKVHKRHLQLQADAAALAAAGSFSLQNCSNTLLASEAYKYGGHDARGALAVLKGAGCWTSAT